MKPTSGFRTAAATSRRAIGCGMRMPVLVCAVLMQQRPPARSRPTPNADPIGDAITAKTTTPTAESPIPRQGWGATVGGHEEESEEGGQKGIDAGSVTSHEGPARIVRLSRPLPGAWKRGKYGGEIVGEEGHGPDVWSLAPAESSQTAIRRPLDLGTRDLASPSLPAIRPCVTRGPAPLRKPVGIRLEARDDADEEEGCHPSVSSPLPGL
jgi:hypothetical protein